MTIVPLLLAGLLSPTGATAGRDGWKEYRKEEKAFFKEREKQAKEFYKERRKREKAFFKERSKRAYRGWDFDD